MVIFQKICKLYITTHIDLGSVKNFMLSALTPHRVQAMRSGADEVTRG